MSYWQASLHGSRVDLEKLHTLIRQPEAEIIREGERYHLRSTRFTPESTWDVILGAARDLIDQVNGQMRISYRNFRPVSVGSVEIVHESGARDYFEMEGESIVRVTDDGTDFLDAVDQPKGEARAREAFAVRLDLPPDQQGAVRLFASLTQDYVNLYRILEIVRKNVGSDNMLIQLGWASKAEIRRFTHTANHPDAAGDEARHGYLNQEPPANPMPLTEAEALIRRLLSHWIETDRDSSSESAASHTDSEPAAGS